MSSELFDAVIGLGQGGGRIAETFSRYFGVRGLYFNLTAVDFQRFVLKKQDTLIIETGGSGRDPVQGESTVRKNFESVAERLEGVKKDGTVAVCVGGGGGSGVGFMWPVLDYLRKGRRKANVLLIYTLPERREGIPVQPNAVKSLDRLVREGYATERGIGVLLVDNDYCHGLYQNASADHWQKTNEGIAVALGRFVGAATYSDSQRTKNVFAGFKTLDMQELKRVLFFGEGFLDIREVKATSVGALGEAKSALRKGSLLNSSMHIQTTKSYVLSVGLPSAWEGARGVTEGVEKLFEDVSRLTRTPYAIQTSYFAGSSKYATVSLLLAGLTKGKSIERQVRTAEKNVARYREKPKDIEIQLGDLEY